MSGVVKGVKKVFKKVAGVVKKIIKPLAVAVAVYFTAGVAMSFMGTAASSFAAGLPGFSGAAGAGTGIFSTAAAKIGLGSGLAGGAAAAGTSLTAIEATYGAATAASLGAGSSVATAGAGTVAELGGMAGKASVAGAATGAAASAPAAAATGMTFGQKLLLASQGANLAAAMFGPTPSEIYEAEAAANAKWRGAFYGMEADGSTGGVPPLAPAPAMEAPQLEPPPSPEQQQLEAGRVARNELFPTARGTKPPEEETGYAGLFGEGQMKQQINVPGSINSPAPGVRYVANV